MLPEDCRVPAGLRGPKGNTVLACLCARSLPELPARSLGSSEHLSMGTETQQGFNYCFSWHHSGVGSPKASYSH